MRLRKDRDSVCQYRPAEVYIRSSLDIQAGKMVENLYDQFCMNMQLHR